MDPWASLTGPGAVMDYGSAGRPWAGAFGPAGPELSLPGLQPAKGLFVQGSRWRLNIVGILVCLLVPWLYYCGLTAALAFHMHYAQPGWAWAIVFLCFCFLLLCGAYAGKSAVKKVNGDPSRSPSWTMFFFLAMLVAFAAAVVVGTAIFELFMRPYYDLENLNEFEGVDPTRMKGQQLMDAGRISFAAGSFVDQTKSMAFRSSTIYCIAPISLGGGPPPEGQYDFWAVGTDCCSGNSADFHCENFNNPRATSAVRLMEEGDKPYYRAAVQQAEATYGIRSPHPLFFRWVPDPNEVVRNYRKSALNDYIAGACAHLLFQLVAVGGATLVFAKLGRG